VEPPRSPRKKFKVAGRVLAVVFWDSIVVLLLLDFLLRGHLTATDTVLD
jgi:hypothetical protein